MEFNICSTCGAKDGRAGFLVGKIGCSRMECQNCCDTRESGNICVHLDLIRTQEELNKTFAILDEIRTD